jgi:MtN3 and saliva related transmembrane protein
MSFITLIGLFAALCTSTSFVPQAVKTIKTKDTSGISLHMYSLFTLGTFLWLLFGLFTTNAPVIAANAITLIFALIILGYKLKYK